ncbi:MAG TPA: tRNA (adenosine(37)-N6)-dimethylallyltransferase MiaA, partial [Pseudohongiella sp.]|nr:tRNA (adenosine(37)-N6)-dimethylallyltransferase MiaA [Pseudohongiella sp.]
MSAATIDLAGFQPENCPAICLMGPTASGKTALAIDLVQRL